MPGPIHEGVVRLFHDRPALVRAMLGALEVTLPEGELACEAETFSDLAPATFAADVVVVVRAGGSARASVIVEVQTTIDPDKPFAWPRYVAAEHARRRCATFLLVVATSSAVAAWARQPVPTFQPGAGFAPLVIDATRVPRITEAAQAAIDPQLAVLSAVVHGGGDDGAIARAAIDAARALDAERGRVGHAQGLAEGRAEGALVARRGLVLRLLQQRFGDVSTTTIAAVEAADGAQLDRIEGRILTARLPPTASADRAARAVLGVAAHG